MASLQPGPSTTKVEEFAVRVPKNVKKQYRVMRFNANQNVEFSKWFTAKMERENNLREFKQGIEEEMPKFGAGSEFGREAREEARRKKYGIQIKKYKADDQPWLLKVGGKTGKKYRGIREGGVGENSSYYVFTQATDGLFEAFPIQEWYNFTPVQRYKALSAEEAEEEFGRRNKIMNYFTVMCKKRLKNEEDPDIEEDGKKGKGRKKKDAKKLTISEMDDWPSSDEDSETSDEEGGKEDKEKDDKKKKGNKKALAKKKKKKVNDDEAFEDSDDGDEEGREVDYMSDSSSESDLEEKTKNQMKGVAEEDALKKLLNSEEEGSDEEENKEGSEKEEDQDKPKDNNEKKETGKKSKSKKKKKNKKEDKKPDVKESNDKSDSSSSDSEIDLKPKKSKAAVKTEPSSSSNSSRCGTPTKAELGDGKRKMPTDMSQPPAKKMKLESSFIGSSDVTEDAVRRYLMRKPMTTTELLQKLRSKKTGLSSDQLVTVIAQILKKINPKQQTIKGRMYLSLRT